MCVGCKLHLFPLEERVGLAASSSAPTRSELNQLMAALENLFGVP